MTMIKLDDGIPRDARGNRIHRCPRCLEWRRWDGFPAFRPRLVRPPVGPCRRCARKAQHRRGVTATCAAAAGRRLEAGRDELEPRIVAAMAAKAADPEAELTEAAIAGAMARAARGGGPRAEWGDV
jgi:hypothetical protein